MQRILILLFSIFITTVYGQQPMTYSYADSMTYARYFRKDYKKLQKTATEALKAGIDFYDLRMRLGISYYEEKRYEKALLHFKKALAMNPANTVVQEYIYYALLFTQRKEDAYDLAETFSPALQHQLEHKTIKKGIAGSFEKVSVTIGALVNNNISKKQEEFNIEKNLQGNTYITNVYVSNRITNRLSIFNSFSYSNVQSLGTVQFFLFPEEQKHYSNNNYQYNTGGNYVFKNNWTVGAYFGYYREQAQALAFGRPDPENFTLQTQDIVHEHHAFTGSLSVRKRIGNFGFGTSVATGNLATVTQWQLEGNVLWYPFGNTNFYSVSIFTWLNNGRNDQAIYTQKIGGKAFKNIWYELKGSYGNHQNYITDGGILAYNTVEPVWLTAEANLTFTFGKDDYHSLLRLSAAGKQLSSILPAGACNRHNNK